MRSFWRWLLRISFNKVYPDTSVLIDEVNAETWIGAQIETGGHALRLRHLKPIGEYEMISISCCLRGAKTCEDGEVKTKDVDYWNKTWKP